MPHGALHTLRAWTSSSQPLGRDVACVQGAVASLTGASQDSRHCQLPFPGPRNESGPRWLSHSYPPQKQPAQPGSWPRQLRFPPRLPCLASSPAASSEAFLRGSQSIWAPTSISCFVPRSSFAEASLRTWLPLSSQGWTQPPTVAGGQSLEPR